MKISPGNLLEVIPADLLDTLLTLSVLTDLYVRQCTIWADVHIHPGTADLREIIIEGRIVSAAENNKNG